MKAPLFFAATLSWVGLVHGQSFQWTLEAGGNGHFYQPVASPGGIGWTDARNAATAMGGYLVTLTSSAENQFVFSLIDSQTYWYSGTTGHNYGPWIGASQDGTAVEPVGSWTWLHGDGAMADTFSSWWPGEPNDTHYVTAPDGEDYAHFGRPGSPTLRAATWNDLPDVPTFNPGDGVLVRSFVVEYDVSPVPEPETVGVLAGCALLGFALWRRYPSLLKPA